MSSQKEKKEKRMALYVIGWIITVLQAIITGTAIYFLVRSSMVPKKMMIAAVAALVILIVICRLLMKKKIRLLCYSIGAIVALAVSAALVVVSVYVNTLTTTLQNVTVPKEEVTRVGVYVRSDDPAGSIQDASEYLFGILDSIAREDTDNAVAQMNEELDRVIQVETYAGMDDLADALLNEECGAIIMGEAYAEVIAELEGYEDFEDQIREIASYEWKTVVEQKENTGTESVVDTGNTESPEGGEGAGGTAIAANGPGIFTVYISGIDTYGSISTKSRSDVNIIAVVNTNTKQVLLISTPRDYYVKLSISGNSKDKLTHAGLYGVQVSMDTLEMLYGVEMDYYFRINFSGFEDMIDALGGVTVVSDYEFDVDSFHYVAGENYLNGIEALAFARERHAFASGDRQRGENQMAVITGVIKKMQSSAMLYHFSDLMTAVEGTFETNMTYSELSTLVRNQISAGAAWDVQTYSVDGTGIRASTYSMSKLLYVMEPNQSTVNKAKELIQAMQNNETISVSE